MGQQKVIIPPPFKQKAMMIEQVIPCIEKFVKETLLGRLEVAKVSLKKNGQLHNIDMKFSALSIGPNLSRTTSTSRIM